MEVVGFILGEKHCQLHVATRFSGDILHFARAPVNSAGKQESLNLQQPPRAPAASSKVLPKHQIKLHRGGTHMHAACIWGHLHHLLRHLLSSISPLTLQSSSLAWLLDRRLKTSLCRCWRPGWNPVQALQELGLMVVLLSFKLDT